MVGLNNYKITSKIKKKLNTIYIVKRFYPGHSDKIIKAVTKTLVKPPVKSNLSLVTQKSTSTSDFSFIKTNDDDHLVKAPFNQEKPKFNTEDIYTFKNDTFIRAEFDKYSKELKKDNWNLIKEQISQIITTGIIPCKNDLKELSKIIDNLVPVTEHQVIQNSLFKQFLLHKKIILKDYSIIAITGPNNSEIKRFLDKSLIDHNYAIINYDFFKLNFKNECITEENFKDKIIFLEKALMLLQTYPNMPLDIFIFIMNKLELISYPDAIYAKDNNFINSNADKTVIVKSGEGIKINNKVYKIIAENTEFKKLSDEFPLDFKQFIDAVTTQVIKGGIIISDPISSAITLSGHHLHVNLAIEDFSNTDNFLMFATFTSTKDNHTILLSDKQLDLSKETNTNYKKLHPKRYENDETVNFPKNNENQANNKAQMIRFNTNIIRLSKKNFEELPKATEYINTSDIRNKILSEVILLSENFCKVPYEKILELTQENLLPIIIKYVENQLKDTKTEMLKYLKKFINISEDKKKNQEKNQIEGRKKMIYEATLPEEFKLLKEIQNKLENLEEKRRAMLKNKQVKLLKEKFNK